MNMADTKFVDSVKVRGSHAADQWARRHNASVDAWHLGDAALVTNKWYAAGILSLGAGIHQWSTLTGYADDGFLGGACFVPMMQAFRAALNGELGPLDGGTLDQWACTLLERYGYDPDSYEMREDVQ